MKKKSPDTDATASRSRLKNARFIFYVNLDIKKDSYSAKYIQK